MTLPQFGPYQNQIEAVFQIAPLAVAIIEMPSLKYVAANANYCQVLRTKLDPQDLVGKTVHEILPTPNNDAMVSLYRAHLSGEATKFDTLVSDSVGENTTYWTGAALPLMKTEQTTLVLGLLTEVTDRVHAQQEAEKKHRELEIEKHKTNGFMAMAVHELRTPLTGLKLLTQSLLLHPKTPLDSETRETLKHIDQKSSQLVQLINDLFNSVKASSEKLPMHLAPTSVADFTSLWIKAFLAEHPLCNLVFENLASSQNDDECTAKIDKERFSQVLLNLINNAMIHNETDASISVRLSHAHDHIILEVSDHGRGIEAADLDKIFDRFYQVSSEKRSSGLGLGLYLSRLIVEGMGGKIWAQSSGIGKGTSFFVRLPKLRNTSK